MKSMTGYGRGQAAAHGIQFTAEVTSVNRKQADINLNLPRDLAELEPKVRDMVNQAISRGRLNVLIDYDKGASPRQKVDVNLEVASEYVKAVGKLQKALKLGGDLSIDMVLRAPGVLNISEQQLEAKKAWPLIQKALTTALNELVAMRTREGKHLARDIRKRLSVVQKALKKISKLHPGVAERYRTSLIERLSKSGLEVPLDDERLVKEVAYYADRSDIAEETTRLECHFEQFAAHLKSDEPIGRTLDFMTQEIYRELNTLGAKANHAEISQHIVTCKSEMEKIREQIQNIE